MRIVRAITAVMVSVLAALAVCVGTAAASGDITPYNSPGLSQQ